MINQVEQIKKMAIESGFYQTGMVDISTLVFDSQIRNICEENTCRSYGTSWACPPAVGSLEQCRRRCEVYDHMMLFSAKYELEDSFDFEGMTSALLQFKKLVEVLDDKLSGCLKSYQLLSNEGCGRCRTCTWPDAPCRFPDKMKHSIEGYGFHIKELAEEAGIRYNNGQNTVTYFGALLFCI